MDTSNVQEDVAAIRKLMEESRVAVYDNGKHFIAWGLLMSAALLGTYVLVARESFGAMATMWVAAILAGWIFSLRAGRSAYRRAPVRTLGDRVLGAIWMGFGVTASLLGMLGLFSGTLPGPALGGTMAILLGGAFFASGFLHGLGWLRYVGLAWWGGGAAMLWWPGLHTLLVFAAMMIAFQVGPGLVLWSRSRDAVEAPAG